MQTAGANPLLLNISSFKFLATLALEWQIINDVRYKYVGIT